jgi:hypothetical protein
MYKFVSWNGHVCEGQRFTTVVLSSCESAVGYMETQSYDFNACRFLPVYMYVYICMYVCIYIYVHMMHRYVVSICMRARVCVCVHRYVG